MSDLQLDVSTDPSAEATRPAEPLSNRIQTLVDRHRRIIFVGIVLLLAVGINCKWRPDPDSALYLTIGRNLAAGHGYTYQGQIQRLVLPGYPLLVAAAFKIFPHAGLLASLLTMPLMGLAALALTYRLFLLHADRTTAVVVTIGLAFTRLFYRSCFEVLTDLPFLVGVLAFFAGFEAIFHRRRDDPRRTTWIDWSLLVGGLCFAVLTRPVMWALLLAIILTLLISLLRQPTRSKQALACLALVALVGICFYLFDPRRRGGEHVVGEYEEAFVGTFSKMGEIYRRARYDFIPRLFEASAAQGLFGSRIGWGLNSLVAVFVLLAGAWLCRIRLLWGIWVFLIILLMLVAVRPLDRYFLPILPLLIYTWWRALVWLNHRLRQPYGDLLFLALLCSGFGTNIARIGEMVVEQHRSPFLAHFQSGRFASLGPLARLLDANIDPGGWVIVPPKLGRILTFRSRCYATNTPERMSIDQKIGPVFVLMPAGDHALAWIRESGMSIGPQIGPTVQTAADPEPYFLHRLVRVTNNPPVP